MRSHKWSMLFLIAATVMAPALSCSGTERVKPVTGTYKQALRKAGEAGKPLMIDFYADWCGWCKKLDSQFEKIPDTMSKFAYYKVNAEQDRALAKQFQVRGYPTIVFVKPDGTELDRWAGYKAAEELKRALEVVIQKAGTIEPTVAGGSGKSTLPPGSDKSAVETAAANELKTAQTYLTVGRTTDATKALKKVIAKYPGTDAAAQAQEKLEALAGN